MINLKQPIGQTKTLLLTRSLPSVGVSPRGQCSGNLEVHQFVVFS